MYRATLDHSPYDVVAWHGNYAPYKYDLANFNAMGSVTFDHPDPSIFTVLTCPFDEVGNAVDVIAFRGRWEVGENTFRPPYYHRNAASEFNMVIRNRTPSFGFDQGAYFLSPQMTPHGVASESFERRIARSAEEANRPERLTDDSLWLMFESSMTIRLTEWALDAPNIDHDYRDIWAGMRSHFDPRRR
jgi:homogentisate 1,2-dioxygenase